MNARGLSLGITLTLAWLAVFASGIGCVYAKHQARKRFVELRELEKERDRLEIEWGQLRLEQSTWATHARVENLAREQLDMVAPDAAEIAVVRQ